jgi:hypothetical protein
MNKVIKLLPTAGLALCLDFITLFLILIVFHFPRRAICPNDTLSGICESLVNETDVRVFILIGFSLFVLLFFVLSNKILK